MGTSATTAAPLRLSTWDPTRAPITAQWEFDKLREARAVSIGELAAASGVAWITIWRAAKGIGTPSTRTRRRLAETLAVQPDMVRWRVQGATRASE